MTPRPAASVVLSRLASAEVTDYRLDMALRWAAIRRVAAVAAFSAEAWQPAGDRAIAEHADIALVSVPADADLATLVRAVYGEIGGSSERALARAEQQGLEAVRRAERAGAGPEELGQAAGRALGTKVEYVVTPPEDGVSVPVQVDEVPRPGKIAAPEAGGEIGIAAGLVLHAAAAAAARHLDLTRRAIETPVRSRSELLAELLMSDSAISEDLLARARSWGSR